MTDPQSGRSVSRGIILRTQLFVLLEDAVAAHNSGRGELDTSLVNMRRLMQKMSDYHRSSDEYFLAVLKAAEGKAIAYQLNVLPFTNTAAISMNEVR